MYTNNQDALNMDSNKMCGFNDKWYPGTPSSTIIKEYETRTLMTNAVKEIMATYDKDQLKEIADHGCQSGVCSQHIYYGDTIKFYEKYEKELIPYFIDQYDVDFLVDLFKESLLGGSLTHYKNAVCWAYIESVAFQVTEDALEEPELTTYGAVA